MVEQQQESDILNLIIKILHEYEIFSGPVTLNSNLKKDLQLDSMGFLTLAEGISEFYKKDLNETFLQAEIKTVGDIVRLLVAKQ